MSQSAEEKLERECPYMPLDKRTPNWWRTKAIELQAALMELYPHIHEDGMENGELTDFKRAWLNCEAALRGKGQGE